MTLETMGKGFVIVLIGLLMTGYGYNEWKEGSAGFQHNRFGMGEVSGYSKDEHPFLFYLLVGFKFFGGIFLTIGGMLLALGMIK